MVLVVVVVAAFSLWGKVWWIIPHLCFKKRNCSWRSACVHQCQLLSFQNLFVMWTQQKSTAGLWGEGHLTQDRAPAHHILNRRTIILQYNTLWFKSLWILTVLHIFWAPYRANCPGDQIITWQSILMMQKQLESRLSKNKIHHCEENMNSWSSHHW